MTKRTRSAGAHSLSYLVTVSRAHLLPTQLLLHTLRRKTDAEIVAVGNLTTEEAATLACYDVRYIDENDIDYTGRLPKVEWQRKHREFGWYKQQFIRLCIDRFMATRQVVILDSEVFVFENWDENRFYDAKTGQPRCGYWTPETRKPDWDYQMYRGAAYLLSFLPECEGIMEYANSDRMKRSITGVALFSTKNIARMWQLLEEKTDLPKNLDALFNKEKDLSFAEYVMYALAVEYGLFDDTVPTKLEEGLLGWYDNHTDPDFRRFQKDAMWSMCQKYGTLTTVEEYYNYMKETAQKLGRSLPKALPYWNGPDRELIDNTYDGRTDVTYFQRYRKQLSHTFRKRFATMYRALELLAGEKLGNPVILEVGTLRDANKGGGHSTYKFGEFCSRFGGTLHTIDILPEAIAFSKKATKDFQPWIQYHTSDSTKFLKKFDGKIDLLYLDGFDSIAGQENAASKKQLEEIEMALSKLSDKAIVLLDDADLPEGGKVAFSSKFLKERGFTCEIDAYQQLYTRGFAKRGPLHRALRKVLGNK